MLVRNRKARHEYTIETTVEAGLALTGSEVKSLRDAHASLTDAYAEERGGELWLLEAQIDPYPYATYLNHEPRRPRKLLLHKAEIRRLATKVREKGLTLVPLEIYLKGSRIKVEIALARGRRQYEKRQAKRTEEARREVEAEEARRRR